MGGVIGFLSVIRGLWERVVPPQSLRLTDDELAFVFAKSGYSKRLPSDACHKPAMTLEGQEAHGGEVETRTVMSKHTQPSAHTGTRVFEIRGM